MRARPLRGVLVRADERSGAARVATRLLSDLGAAVDRTDGTRSAATLEVGPVPGHAARWPVQPITVALTSSPTELPGTPAHTHHTACGYAAAAAAALGLLSRRDCIVDVEAVRDHVLLPALVTAAEGRPPPSPAEPVPIGDGFVDAVLTTEDGRDRLARLLQTMGDDRYDPQAVAAMAQHCGMAVLPHAPRRRHRARERVARVFAAGAATPPDAGAGPTPADIRETRAPAVGPLDGVEICDLTAMWAGPLATWILSALGASVTKIEPSCRPDGLRWYLRQGTDSADGWTNPSLMFRQLDEGKRHADLDLRRPADRREFESRLARADLVVDSFSPRVLPNLGYPIDTIRHHAPGILTTSVRAFPGAGPRRTWVGYGAGIHAASGLSDAGVAAPVAAAVSYPDALAGLAAAAAMLAQVAGRRTHSTGSDVEVSLWSATSELVGRPRSPRLSEPVAPDGAPSLAGAGAIRAPIRTAESVATTGGTS